MAIGGAFAVEKDEVEDRVISDCMVNQLLDPAKIPRPKFAYLLRLRGLTSTPGLVRKVSKRDARHYFHQLRLHRRWEKFLSGPAAELGPSLWPRHPPPVQRCPKSAKTLRKSWTSLPGATVVSRVTTNLSGRSGALQLYSTR